MSREDGLARIESVQARFPDALRLARVASLAVRIEPHLLRQLRLRLVRDADVGAEADLWFSLLVESRGVDAVVLHRDVAAILREELTGHARLDEIVSIVADAHRDEPSTITLEERVNALAVRQGSGAIEQIDRELRAAILAMRESDARAREIARWFLRAFPRLHPIVLQCPNAIGLLLSASMLLGRRSATRAVEAKGSLADVRWMLPPEALKGRITIGIQRLPGALRFVEFNPAAGGSIGKLEVPPPEPRLVEITWEIEGRTEQRVVEAISGASVTLGPNASNVHVVTLAGDDYELTSRAGAAEPSTTDASIDLTPYARILQSVVTVKTISEPPVGGVAVRVHRNYLITAREPFGWEAAVRLTVDADTELRCPVVPMPGEEALIAIESSRGGVEPAPLATAPLHLTRGPQEGLLERAPAHAVIIGFDGQTFRGVEGEAQIADDDFTGREFRVLVPNARPWFGGMTGGPAIMDGRVRGIVNRVDFSQAGETASLNVIGSERIMEMLEGVVAQSQTPARADVPPWVADVCVGIYPGAEAGAIATGLIISDRLVVSTSTDLRESINVTVAVRDRTVPARVLAGEGPLVFIGVSSGDRFDTRAPLIRSTIRIRRPDDPPDPPDAMLVAFRDGLQTMVVPNATRAGVVKARDPDGYRFNVAISERPFPFSGFEDGVLVWGDVVAGIAISSSREPNATQNAVQIRERTEFISVNVIKESIESVTARLEELERQEAPAFRVWLSSVPGDLHDHIEHAQQQVQRHHGSATRFDVADGIVGPKARQEAETLAKESDLFVLVVGNRRLTMKGLEESVAQFEYEVARRAGIDVLVFLSQDESGIRDRRLLAWRRELRERHPVQLFSSLDEFQGRLDTAVVQWREARGKSNPRDAPAEDARPVTPEGTSGESERGAPTGNHAAKVVVYGAERLPVSLLLQRITEQRLDPGGRTRERVIRWVTHPPSAPGVSAALIIHEALVSENWPLSLDTEYSSVVVVVIPPASNVEVQIREQLAHVRAAHATVPIVIALTHDDVSSAALESLIPVVSAFGARTIVAVSTKTGRGVDQLLTAILESIRWDDETAMTDEGAPNGRVGWDTVSQRRSMPTVLRLPHGEEPDRSMRFGRLLGERRLGDYFFSAPEVFEALAFAITSSARRGFNGFPGAPLRQISSPSPFSKSPFVPKEIDQTELFRVVANDLVARGLVEIVTGRGQPVVVSTSALETAAEPSIPPEARPIVRAQWTGSGRNVFIEVLFDYSDAFRIESSWQRSLSRGRASIGDGPTTIYLEAIESGEVAEMTLTGTFSYRSSGITTIERGFRSVLQRILGGNATLTIETPEGGNPAA